MRVPVSWLREYVDLPPELSVAELANRLTFLGLKLEALEAVAAWSTIDSTSMPRPTSLRSRSSADSPAGSSTYSRSQDRDSFMIRPPSRSCG